MDATLTILTSLAQRLRLADPFGASFEAADLQWWSRRPRPRPPALWSDDRGPCAAVVFTTWKTLTGLTLLGDHPGMWDEVDAGLAAVEGPFQLEVPADDRSLIYKLEARGFTPDGDGFTDLWRSTAEVVEAPLPAGYVMVSRATHGAPPHWMIERSGPEIEAALQATSLYRAGCDLAVLAADGSVAGYALFWPDPVTGVGLVEPMRVEDAHWGRRLGTALMAEGVSRLLAVGCSRLKVTFENGNTAAERLYVGAGFVPTTTTISLTRPA